MSEDDRRQQYDLKDMKTPEEVAKIIEVNDNESRYLFSLLFIIISTRIW
jgi:hypothetical protein